MKNLSALLSLLLISTLFGACQKETEQDIAKEPEREKVLTGTITLNVLNKEPTPEEQFLVLLTKDNGVINMAEIDYSQSRPVMLDYEKWKEEGTLVDTFYSAKGGSSIRIETLLGDYFTHLYDVNGDKSVESFSLTDSRREGERFTEIRELGHLRITVAASTIIGSEIDSVVVNLYEGGDKMHELLTKTIRPLDLPFLAYRTGVTAPDYMTAQGAPGVCFFFNLPKSKYVVAGYFGNVWPGTQEENKSATKVHVKENDLSLYKIHFH